MEVVLFVDRDRGRPIKKFSSHNSISVHNRSRVEISITNGNTRCTTWCWL